MKLFHQVKPWLDQWWQAVPTSFPPRYSALRTQSRKHSTLIAIVSVAALTATFGQRFYNDPQLAVGTPAPETIRAPRSAIVEDKLATQQERAAARKSAAPVFMLHAPTNEAIQQNLQQRLEQGREIRKLAGPLPFSEKTFLPLTTQRYLRQSTDAQWFEILERVQHGGRNTATAPAALDSASDSAIAQLQAYRKQFGDNAWFRLRQIINQSRQRYQTALTQVSTFRAREQASLLDLSEPEWQATQQDIQQISQQMLSQGIPRGLPPNLLENAIGLNLKAQSVAAPTLAKQILLEVLQPNLVIDRLTTLKQAEKAAQQVEPILLPIQKGAIIVQAGQPVTDKAFVFLDYFRLSRRGVNWSGLLGTALLVSGGVAIFWQIQERTQIQLSKRDYLLILLLALSAPLSAWLSNLSYTSLPAVGLLVGSFYGSPLGATVMVLLAVLMPLGLNPNPWELVPVALGGLVAAVMAGQRRSREEIALLGIVVGLVQGVTYLLVMSALGISWYGLMGAALWRSGAGLGWSIIALGVSPYLEHLFDLVTPIRLAELANPNRSILQRLAREAPGTFQHTLCVANLAEAGARALACNVELVRTGTLYHDIGKMHDPLAFIENQMGLPNKHEQINDPWISVEIIKKHVSEGLVLARKHRLPTAIQAFIPEHQGTMLVAYFYHQAQQRVGEHEIREADFRYVGPVPQSRETAIVMLADSCEAALRSLRNAPGQSLPDVTPEVAIKMVNKIFKARWQDQQLVDSHLTRAELDQLAQVFVEVWFQFNHQRVRYPGSLTPLPSSTVKAH